MRTARKGRETLALRTYHPEMELEVDWVELEAHWPGNLIKACCDPFGYALGLRDGTVIRFGEAQPTGGADWVHLSDVAAVSQGPLAGIDLGRGIDVAVRDITWVVDAPSGS